VTPAPAGRDTTRVAGEQARPPTRWWPLAVLVVMLAVNFGLSRAALGPEERVRIPYQPTFLEQLRSGNVRSILTADGSVQGEAMEAIRYPPDDDAPSSTQLATHVPEFADDAELNRLLARRDVVIDARPPDTGAPLWETLLPTLLLFGLLFFVFRRFSQRAGGMGGLGGLGRAKVTRADPAEVRVSFDDVAGIDEVKDEIVGIGASRVRDLFRQAKEAAPAISFIDELDAVGPRGRGRQDGRTQPPLPVLHRRRDRTRRRPAPAVRRPLRVDRARRVSELVYGGG
jgi:cell division protease FtsH